MKYGTCYFVSIKSAEKYFKPYHYDDVKKAVQNKIKEGTIHIGIPSLEVGEYTTIEEGRYIINIKE